MRAGLAEQRDADGTTTVDDFGDAQPIEPRYRRRLA
jgi:hypothetical protein